MNEIIKTGQQLPDTLEDLTQFVLVGKAKLQAYMLKIQTINKLSVAQEVRDQTLKEAQEISTALIAAEQRIGELLLAIPKQTGNQYTSANSTQVEKAKSKSETIKNMGYSKDEASDYQQMAKNPKVVHKVIDDALAKGDIVTKSSVMREIKFYKDRIKTLESQEPKVVEVVPDDYEKVKEELKSYKAIAKSAEEARVNALRRESETKAKIREMEKREGIGEMQKKLERDTEYLDMHIANFIRTAGGYVWITERIEDLPEDKRAMIIRAIQAIGAWSNQMIINIGGGDLLNGKRAKH